MTSDMVAQADSQVNSDLFNEQDYRLLVRYEVYGEEFSPATEQAYLRLGSALMVGQLKPTAVPPWWWEAQRKYWEIGKV